MIIFFNMIPQYPSGKTVVNTGVGAGGTWTVGEAGIHTTKSVGIGTTARSDFKLYVSTGSTTDTVAYFDGNISIAGSTFSREVVEIESLGIITATKGVDVISGGINAVGVITATSFDGSLATTDLTGTITNAQLAGSIAKRQVIKFYSFFGWYISCSW